MSAQDTSSHGTRFVFTKTGKVVYAGTGSPEGVQTGTVGDFYAQSDAGVGDTALWYKAAGTATTTGWMAVGGGGAGVWTRTGTVLTPTTAGDVVHGPVEVARMTTTGHVTLTAESARFQFLILDADRDCTLPAAATGMAFTIKHAGTSYTLTIKDASAVSLALVAAGEAVTVIYDGTAWEIL